MFEPQPTPKAIASLAGTNIVAIAAGHNHALAVDDTGFAYAWGNGGAPRCAQHCVDLKQVVDIMSWLYSRLPLQQPQNMDRMVVYMAFLQGMAVLARMCSRMSTRQSGWMHCRSVSRPLRTPRCWRNELQSIKAGS